MTPANFPEWVGAPVIGFSHRSTGKCHRFADTDSGLVYLTDNQLFPIGQRITFEAPLWEDPEQRVLDVMGVVIKQISHSELLAAAGWKVLARLELRKFCYLLLAD